MKSVANYGARHDRMAISVKDFMALPIPYPCEQEREKIALFLKALDFKIDAISGKSNKTEAFNEAFPQELSN